MRRGTGLLVLVGVTAVVSLAVTHLPEALAESSLFRVAHVEIEGARFLPEDEARSVAALAADANLWDDPEPVEARLRSHPLVREARVRRRLPRTLVLEVTEREPVALVPTPVLAPVDREGRTLPLDPGLHVLDLPLLRPRREGSAEPLAPGQLRLLASEVDRIARLDPLVHAALSEAGLGPRDEVVLRLVEPNVTLRYVAPLTHARLREGLLALADAIERHPARRAHVVDLRFADQVVLRLSPTHER